VDVAIRIDAVEKVVDAGAQFRPLKKGVIAAGIQVSPNPLLFPVV